MGYSETIPEMNTLSEAKRELLERYLRGDVARTLGDHGRVPPISKHDSNGPAPLSFAQQQVWVHSQISPDLPIYNEPFTIHRTGALDVAALERVLTEIIRRHEAWRTVFPEVNGQPVQVVQPAPKAFVLPQFDLRKLGDAEREAKALELAAQDAQRPFDLAKGPLLRAKLVRLADEQYRLYLTLHQIILDGVTAYNVLLPELVALYEAFSHGQPSPLPELSFQHVDYACWQRQWFTENKLAEQLGYWRRRLDGELPVLELPTDRPRPATQSFRGAMYPLQLPKALVERVRNFSQREGATLFMGMLAGFYALLNRYTGQDDILLGTLTASRKGEGAEKLLGYFVNPVVIRTRFIGDPSFRELLVRVRQTVLDALAHDDVPFELLVETLQPPRDSSRNPLFQIMLSLEPPMPPVKGWSMTQFDVGSGASKFDLYLDLDDREEGIIGPVTYNPDLFDGETIERMVKHWQSLLEAAVADPTCRISQLPLLTAPEQRQLLVEWNRTASEQPAACLPGWFEAQVEQTPDAIAVEDEESELSYRELNRRANQLARHLRGLGIGPEKLVGICTTRSQRMIVALLGVLKAGGAYVPLDPAYPQERLAYMLEDSGVEVLLTEQALLAGLPSHAAHTVCLDQEEALWAEQSGENLPAEAQAENLAYVIYTSGSTGKPKGVQISQGALVNLLRSMQQEPGLGGDDRLLAVTTLSFDIAALELFLPLLTGARLVLASGETARDGVRLQRRLQEAEITVMQATPATWRLLLETGWAGDRNLRIWCGGEALTRELAEQLLPRCAALWNMYGPTETTIWSAVERIEPGTGPIRIGLPVANTEFYVLDGNLQLLPVGIAGELHIGGQGLARGYLHQAELTEQKFIAHPFRAQAGSRLYKTGDLVRRLGDGRLEFLGRLDDQVKVRGFRIELGEIESALSQHAGVKAAVVDARVDGLQEKQLVAYVVPQGTVSAEDLRAALRQRLPDYMVPSQFVFLSSLPLTPNGKVNRRALPGPEPVGPATAEKQMQPRDAREKKLAEIWEAVLGVSPIGIQANFFDLGGHSLLAAKIISQIETAFGTRLSLGQVFRAPTVEQLAVVLQQAPSRTPSPAITRRDPHGPASLSHGEQQVWLHSQLAGDLPLYNEAMTLHWHGALDAGVLEQSLGEIARRHEILRTSFYAIDGQPVRKVHPPSSKVGLQQVDLRQVASSEREQRALALASDDARRPFDLSRSPLFRALIVRLGEAEYRLFLTLHHIVFDGLSIYGVFIPELNALYEAYANGKSSPLADLSIQYSDYAAWERKARGLETMEPEMAYWRNRLAGEPPILALPADRPRPALQTFRGAMQKLVLSRKLSQAVRTLGQRKGSSTYALLLAAFKALLCRYSGQQDIWIGGITSGRSRPELNELIGYFINIVVLRTDVVGDPTFEELLTRVQLTVLEAISHDEVPFELVVKEVHPKRDASRSPLVQVLFSLITPALQESGWSLTNDLDIGVTKYDLHLELEDRPEGITGCLLYSTDLFDGETIERMVKHWQSLLEAAVADPTCRISQLPLLTAPEQRQLLVEWNRTASEQPAACLPGWFEAQVEQTPDAIAVEDEESELSYRELNRRANQLARHLRGLGIGPEKLVGICTTRSQRMIVALLGVLKAGGAYVPLDPAYPQERLAYMLEDSGVEVLLTEQALLAGLPSHAAHTVCLDQEEALWAEQSGENLPAEAQAENLAYVIYTSGSTGKPKGVQISQGALVNLLRSMQQEPGLGGDDRLLAVTTLSFDIAALELFLPLLTGARLVLASGETARDGVRLQRRLQEAEITVMQATPATWRLLLETGWAGDRNLRIWCGGEALTRELAEQLLPRCAALWNMYGPTETTIWSAVERIEPGTGPIRIGLPVANTEFYVLDGNLQLLPVGIVGELHIGGQGLARGYLHQAELTEQKFIAHPFRAQAGSRLYKTGDLVRRLGDGRLEFLGRLDDQVKVRGFRIELGEIESALSQHAGVKAAVVDARVDGLQEKQLVAYVVPQGTVSAEDLRAALRQRLPDYMVPSQFVFLSSLPLTPNGKVNRRALPGPEPVGPATAEKQMQPRDAREKKLAEIWEAVLGVSPIGIQDNFFDLGGHSLLAAKLVATIEKTTGERLSLSDVFRAPTIANMAILLRQQEQAQEFSGIIPIQPHGSKPPLFWVRGATLFLALARRLGLDQPSFGLHLPEAEASQLSRRCTLEEIAGAFVRKMRQVQPEGPYHLAGLCVNGVLAYEMARQITAAGQEVALLVMFDAQNPVYYRDYSQEGLYNVLGQRMVFHFQKLTRVRVSDLGLYARERWNGVRRRWNRVRWHLAYERGWRAEEDLQNLDGIVHPAAEAYRPGSYNGRVVLFQSTDWPDGQYWDLRLGWSKVASSLDYQRIEGAHEAIFHEDNVEAFALKLTKCLRDARAEISRPSLDFVAD